MTRNKLTFKRLLTEWQNLGGTLEELSSAIGKTRMTLFNFTRRDTLKRAEEAIKIYDKVAALVEKARQKSKG